MPGGEFGFEPDAERAARLSAEIADRFAASLRIVADRLADQPGVDRAALDRLAEETAAARRLDPTRSALFHRAVAAFRAGDRTEAARLVGRLGEFPQRPRAMPPQVADLDDADLGPGVAAIFAELVDVEPDNRLDFVAAGPATKDRVKAYLARAAEIMRADAPALAAEIEQLTTLVVVADQGPERLITAHGVSAFEIWGAVCLQGPSMESEMDFLESFTHECAHLLLYALAVGGPVVENPRDQRIWSPFRGQFRTVDGVFHATFVLARMIYVLDAALAGATLTAGERAEAERRRAEDFETFLESLSFLREHAIFTERGRPLIDGAEAYVRRSPVAAAVSA
jgi:HEXXH motif-containing protein